MEEDKIPNGGFPPLYYKSIKKDTNINLPITKKINLEKLIHNPSNKNIIDNINKDQNITEIDTI
uniref:Uncharacterized protein n=1 Tax=viral metagenome TaxID=1070528 RepID=A0A6C0H8V0_9ZZZZ